MCSKLWKCSSYGLSGCNNKAPMQIYSAAWYLVLVDD